MKRIILFFCLIFSIILNVNAQGKRMQVWLSYATFNSPVDGPYLETYLIVNGKSTNYVLNENGKFQSKIEVTLIFKKDSVIKDFRKLNLLSPEISDTTKIDFDFMDQQRIPLPTGIYQVEYTIADKNAGGTAFKGIETIVMEYPSDRATVSDIELVQQVTKTIEPNIFTKNGYDLQPYFSYFYPEVKNKLTYYSEIYNTDKKFQADEKFLINTYIEFAEKPVKVGEFVKNKKEVPKNVIVNLGEFDISQLPTGKFKLVVEVMDKNLKVVAMKKSYFERINNSVPPIAMNTDITPQEHSFVEMFSNKDTLAEYIRSLAPISSENEIIFARNQVARGDLNSMQKYFYSFWSARDENNPGGAWATYWINVQRVNAEFSTRIKKGYETDRGRVYLSYGEPNTIAKEYNEPSAYPYEIWHYYSCKNQKNKKFVFCNQDLATNDFKLIHSDAIGEIYDYKWQQQIYGRNNTTNDIDSDGVRDHFGRKADELFNNPR